MIKDTPFGFHICVKLSPAILHEERGISIPWTPKAKILREIHLNSGWIIKIDYFANELIQAFEEKDVSTKFQKLH